jgi:hypothetical protein
MDYVFILKFISVIIAVALTDMCWALYFIKIGEKKPVHSAVWASFLMLFGAFTTISYMGNKELIIAAIIGAFIGTYFTVKYHDFFSKK